MGKRMLRGWQGRKALREVGGGEGGQEGEGMGRGEWQRGGGDREGESGRGQWGGEQQGRKEGGNGEGAMGKGGGEDGKDATGRGEGVKRWRQPWGEEGARGGEISQMDMMGCLGGHRL